MVRFNRSIFGAILGLITVILFPSVLFSQDTVGHLTVVPVADTLTLRKDTTLLASDSTQFIRDDLFIEIDSINFIKNEILNEVDSIAMPADSSQIKADITITEDTTPIPTDYDKLYGINIQLTREKPEVDLHYSDTLLFTYKYMPIVFRGKIWGELDSTFSLPKGISPYAMDIVIPQLYTDKNRMGNFYQDVQNEIINSHIGAVKYSYKDFPQELERTEEIKVNPLQMLFTVEYDPAKTDESNKPGRIAPKRRYWKYSGEHILRFNQYHFSGNWHKGGSNYMNLISDQKFGFNYAKGKISVTNSVRWQLTQNEAKNDTLRRFAINLDQLEIVNTFNINVIKNWTYTNRLELRTRVLNKYNANTKDLNASFLNPLDATLGLIGGTYKLNKSPNKKLLKNISLSVIPSPVTVTLNYMQNEDLGSYEGKQHQIKFGAGVDGELILTLYKDIVLKTRYKYHTTYEKILIELENNFTMNLNRYFNVNFTFYPRFDDTRTDKNNPAHRDKKWGYVQVYDMFSFGFTYRW